MTDPLGKKGPPLPTHWKSYVAIRFIVVILAIALTFYLAGVFRGMS